MARLNIIVAHQLSKEEALSRLKEISKHFKSQFLDKITNLEEKWEGNIGSFRFLAKGHPVTGTVIVNPSRVELNFDLPFAVRFFKDRIEKAIREKADELLSSDSETKKHLHSESFAFNFALFCTSIWLFLWLSSEILPDQTDKKRSRIMPRKIKKEDAKEAVKVLFGP